MNYKTSSLIVLATTTLIAGMLLVSKERTFTLSKEPETLTKADIVSIENYRPTTIAPEAGKAVAEIIAKDILEKNPNGPLAEDSLRAGEMSIATSKPEEIVDKILSQQTGRVRDSLFNPTIDQTKFIISDKETTSSYLAARASIIEAGARAIAGFKIETVDDKAIQKIIGVSDVMLGQLYAMPIPKEMVSVHTEQIRVLMGERTLFSHILNRAADPVAAAISVSLIPELQKATDDFHQKLIKLLKSVGVKP